MLVEDALDRVEVDLARAGLAATGDVGDVDGRHPRQPVGEVVDQPPADELLVVGVEEDTHLRMVELAADLERRAEVAEEVGGDEDAVHRLKRELDRPSLDELHALAQALDAGAALLGVRERWPGEELAVGTARVGEHVQLQRPHPLGDSDRLGERLEDVVALCRVAEPAVGVAEEAGDPDPRLLTRGGEPVDVLAAPVPQLDEVEAVRGGLARPLRKGQVGPHELDRDRVLHAGPMVAPPFTSRVWPVTMRADGLHR